MTYSDEWLLEYSGSYTLIQLALKKNSGFFGEQKV